MEKEKKAEKKKAQKKQEMNVAFGQQLSICLAVSARVCWI